MQKSYNLIFAGFKKVHKRLQEYRNSWSLTFISNIFYSNFTFKTYCLNIKQRFRQFVYKMIAELCCLTAPCKNGSTCNIDLETGTSYCVCSPGFTGPFCDGKTLIHGIRIILYNNTYGRWILITGHMIILCSHDNIMYLLIFFYVIILANTDLHQYLSLSLYFSFSLSPSHVSPFICLFLSAILVSRKKYIIFLFLKHDILKNKFDVFVCGHSRKVILVFREIC